MVLSPNSPLSTGESFWLAGDLTREWSHRWPRCASTERWQAALFGVADLDAVRAQCAASSEASDLLEYAAARRKSLSAVTVSTNEWEVVRGPDDATRHQLLGELEALRRHTRDPWLQQRYDFLQLRIRFHADRQRSLNSDATFGPSRIISSLARSYIAGHLASIGSLKEAMVEFERVENEESEFARGIARQRCTTVADVEVRARRAPRSEWLFRCVVEAMSTGDADDAFFGRVAPSHSGLESLVRRVAAAPETRKPFRLWFAAAWLAAGRGDAAATERALERASLPNALLKERELLDSLSSQARFIATASSLPSTSDFSALRRSAEVARLSANSVVCRAVSTARALRAAARMQPQALREVMGWRTQPAGALRHLMKRRQADPDLRWFFDLCLARNNPKPDEELERVFALALIAERRFSELEPSTSWKLLQTSSATRPRVRLPNGRAASWFVERACLSDESPAVCFGRLEKAKHTTATREMAVLAILALTFELGQLASSDNSVHNPEHLLAQRFVFQPAVVALATELLGLTKDRETLARAAFLLAFLTKRPTWFQKLSELSDTNYERQVLDECSHYRRWKTRQP